MRIYQTHKSTRFKTGWRDVDTLLVCGVKSSCLVMLKLGNVKLSPKFFFVKWMRMKFAILLLN